MRGARGRAYAIDGGLWYGYIKNHKKTVKNGQKEASKFMCGGGMVRGCRGWLPERGGWRVAASELVDRIDPVTRSLFGVGRKTLPEKFSGGGGVVVAGNGRRKTFSAMAAGGRSFGREGENLSVFSWVFFLATKDETSGILKTFITGIENQINHKVKIIRCDNGIEFKNNDMNQFCGMKGIKREFSVARTPQQNKVAERKNRTLIEEARTMLADLLLPTTFWAEAVNTACYV
ncbi:putative ribonuclease H-like domain-containing protein [Tanacetum coccineum]